ncbi:hypothetical protein TWF569_000065 [Orbilia oligospora]|uniref:Uncharacterized protein n=1 Tax=Orbilia oligospora TaxID=2813651 RepID=A0A7C8NYM6_ORBOL|nr:hypothetical protein TWF594_011660 [Orbilia oligospora]KAF3147371.1 hypothetical protein TWF703_000212 [Orbilia oligospora]KAF3157486.1 hypothetical protein TWF569_000065 [Orbilia oligospora]
MAPLSQKTIRMRDQEDKGAVSPSWSIRLISLIIDASTIWSIWIFILLFALIISLFLGIIFFLVLKDRSERSKKWFRDALPKNELNISNSEGVGSDLEAGVHDENSHPAGQRAILRTPAHVRPAQTIVPSSRSARDITKDIYGHNATLPTVKEGGSERTIRTPSYGSHNFSTGVPTSPCTSMDNRMSIPIFFQLPPGHRVDIEFNSICTPPKPLPQVHLNGSQASEYVWLSSGAFDSIERQSLLLHSGRSLDGNLCSRFSEYSSENGN